VHRRTVRQALTAAAPPTRKPRVFAAPKLDPAKPLIDAMLREDLTAHRKQQHTARRVLARLVDEHGMHEVSYASVRDYVARRRPQIQAEAGRTTEQAFVPQTHAPGEQAEVDFGDVWLTLADEKTRCFMFTYRLSFSGAAVHRIYASQGQEAFIEGTWRRSGSSGSRRCTSATTTSRAPSPGCCSGARVPSPTGGRCSARTPGSTPSTACPGSRERTRRAASRARSAGSAATTSSRSPTSRPWASSTPGSSGPTRPTWPAGSRTGRAPSGTTSSRSGRCSARCRPRGSTPV